MKPYMLFNTTSLAAANHYKPLQLSYNYLSFREVLQEELHAEEFWLDWS